MQHSTGEPFNTVGIVAALAAEARQLGPAERRSDALAVLASGARLAVSGAGPAAAERSARRLVAAGCRALVSWGLAGGLDPALSAGAIVLPEEVRLDDGSSLRVSAAWREQVVQSLRSSHGLSLGAVGLVGRGSLLTLAHPLGAVAEKALAYRDTGAVAVDMESFAVAGVAMAHGLPFLAVRVIVDTATDELPSVLAGAANAAGQVSVGRLVGGLLSQPSELTSLLRLARRYRAATRSLRAIARAGAVTAYAA